jgi:hypothetical protein
MRVAEIAHVDEVKLVERDSAPVQLCAGVKAEEEPAHVVGAERQPHSPDAALELAREVAVRGGDGGAITVEGRIGETVA